MRPIWLEMTAFGSYAEKTRVPFEDLRNELYLVTGDTGAGKTTIFDAIAFALFGEASGSVRTVDMMHCDLVDKSVDTVVSLRFDQGGREIEVTRTIHFPKRRGEGGFGDRQVNARLLEPDHQPLEGAERVTRRVEELLGMNAGQFRKIVMLAQGEFRVFLSADSDKKAEILGRLFDNSAYVRYQELLAGTRDELQRRRTALRERLDLLLQGSLRLPQSLTEEERLRFRFDAPELLPELDALAEGYRGTLERTARDRDEARARLSALDAQKGAAEAVNAQLKAMERVRSHLKELELLRGAMDARRERLERADAAFQRAKPSIDASRRADRALSATRAELELLEQASAACGQALLAAERAAEGDEQKRERILALGTELGEIERQIQALRSRGILLDEQRTLTKTTADADTELRRLEQSNETLQARRDELRRRLDSRDGADEAVLRCQERLQSLESARDELLALRRSLDTLERDSRELDREQERLLRDTEAAQAAGRRHYELYQHFIAGQAGLMAEDLRRRLREDGEAVCPVCASKLDRGHLSRLAAAPEETPNEQELERAKKAAESAEQARAAQFARTERARARLESGREAALNGGKRLLPELESWEQLAAGALLEDAVARRQEELAAADAELRRAQETQRQREKDRKALESTLQQLEQTSADWEERSAAQQVRKARLQTLEALIASADRDLRFASEAEAAARSEALGRERTRLNGELEQTRQALEKARRERDTLTGSLREKRELAERQEREQREALEAMTQALRDAGFPDREEAEAALLPLAGAEPLGWLRQEREAINSYEGDLRHSAEELRRLEEQLADKRYTDLEALEKQIWEANALFGELNERWSRMERQLLDLVALRQQAGQLRDELERTERAWRRLDLLGSLAVGVNSESGRLSFDRYVIGAVFREVLEMANRRMDVMSGGRYQLVHRSSADRRNAKAGLDIQVLDLSTGQLRGADSLSGGEGFFTSLALALGLSDVVQTHAGGRDMDALFIDEGFGSLSDDVLDKAIEVLYGLSGGERLVGIISHVDKLDECIPQKIRVRNGKGGSTLRLELA